MKRKRELIFEMMLDGWKLICEMRWLMVDGRWDYSFSHFKLGCWRNVHMMDLWMVMISKVRDEMIKLTILPFYLSHNLPPSFLISSTISFSYLFLFLLASDYGKLYKISIQVSNDR